MIEFHKRLEHRIRTLGMNMNEVSKAIERPPQYISNMISNRSTPGCDILFALASVLQTTPNDLLGYSGRYQIIDKGDVQEFLEEHAKALADAVREKAREQLCSIGAYPPVKEVYKWAVNCGKRVDTTEDITQFFTTYEAPDRITSMPKAAFVGPQSLARNSLGTITAGELNDLIKRMPDAFVGGLIKDQLKLTESDPTISVEHIPVNIPEAGVNVDFSYLRLYLRLMDRDNKPIILNYSEPMD